MQRDGAAERLFDVARGGDVIQMRMCVYDPLYFEIVMADDLADFLWISAGIDDHAALGVGTAEDGAVALERTDGKCLEQQHGRTLRRSGRQHNWCIIAGECAVPSSRCSWVAHPRPRCQTV